MCSEITPYEGEEKTPERRQKDARDTSYRSRREITGWKTCLGLLYQSGPRYRKSKYIDASCISILWCWGGVRQGQVLVREWDQDQ